MPETTFEALLLFHAPLELDPGLGEARSLPQTIGHVFERIGGDVDRLGHFQFERVHLVPGFGVGVVVLAQALVLGLEPLEPVVQALPDPVQIQGGFEHLILSFGDGDRLRHVDLPVVVMISAGSRTRNGLWCAATQATASIRCGQVQVALRANPRQGTLKGFHTKAQGKLARSAAPPWVRDEVDLNPERVPYMASGLWS